MADDTRALVERIQAWRKDDKQGMASAIELICDAEILLLAALSRPAPAEDVAQLDINAYSLVASGRDVIEVQILRRRQRDGSSRWIVSRLSSVLTKAGEWEYEPIPSSRDDTFIARTRFDSPSEALTAYRTYRAALTAHREQGQ